MELLIKGGFFLLFIAVGWIWGRINERRHLRELARQEKALADVLVFATRYPAMRYPVCDPVLVSGSVVIGADYFRFFVAGLRKIVGGNYRGYEQLLERARRQAMVRLKQEAKARGAKAVFNLSVTASRISNRQRGELTQVEVLMTGTAFVPAVGSVAQSRVHHRAGPAPEDPGLFSLHKQRFLLWWLLGWVGAVVAIIGLMRLDDLTGREWRYLDDAPTRIFFVLALVAVGMLWRRARARRASWLGCVVLSLMSLPTLVATQHLLVLQLNGLLGSRQEQVYRVEESGALAPVNGQGTPLYFGEYSEYWEHQPPGTEVRLWVVSGPLPVRIYDMAPLRARYMAYYR